MHLAFSAALARLLFFGGLPNFRRPLQFGAPVCFETARTPCVLRSRAPRVPAYCTFSRRKKRAEGSLHHTYEEEAVGGRGGEGTKEGTAETSWLFSSAEDLGGGYFGHAVIPGREKTAGRPSSFFFCFFLFFPS